MTVSIVGGTFEALRRKLLSARDQTFFNYLHEIGKRGVSTLEATTPVDTGATASSWDYTIDRDGTQYTLTWTNSVMADRIPLVILIRYGHGTGTGGYVQGNDFVTPALEPLIDDLMRTLGQEVF